VKNHELFENLYHHGNTIILVTHDGTSRRTRVVLCILRDGLIEMDHVGFIQTRPAGCEIISTMKRFLYELSESWKIAAAHALEPDPPQRSRHSDYYRHYRCDIDGPPP